MPLETLFEYLEKKCLNQTTLANTGNETKMWCEATNPVLAMVDILLQGNGQKTQRFHSGETNSA